MTETVPQEWPDAALSYLDALWAGDTHMAVIRKKLMPLLGFYPTSPDVIAMARRYAGKPVKIVVAVPAEPKPDPFPLNTYHFVPPPKQDNTVRLVAPGTFKAKGFTMLGKRT